MRQQVAAAEAALRSGDFEATILNRDGSRSSARVRFHLGDQQQAPAFHMITLYEGIGGAPPQVAERISIGDRSWQRAPNGDWSAIPEQEGAWGQVQAFLPRVAAAPGPTLGSEGSATVLQWYDAPRDVDVTLLVDPATGVPREMRQVTRATGSVLTVVYKGWNAPVDIAPPVAP